LSGDEAFGFVTPHSAFRSGFDRDPVAVQMPRLIPMAEFETQRILSGRGRDSLILEERRNARPEHRLGND
jgi:hypothetical protein